MKGNIKYKSLKTSIERGNVEKFADMREIVPITLMADDMKANYITLRKRLAGPANFTVKELYNLSELLEMDPRKLFEMALIEYATRYNKPLNFER
jgi:hypothetical protein